MRVGTFRASAEANEGATVGGIQRELWSSDWGSVGMRPRDGRVLATIDPESGSVTLYWRESKSTREEKRVE